MESAPDFTVIRYNVLESLAIKASPAYIPSYSIRLTLPYPRSLAMIHRLKLLARRESLAIAGLSLILTIAYHSLSYAAPTTGSRYVTMSERIGNVLVLFRNLDVWIYFFQGILLFGGIGLTIYYMVVFHRKPFVAGLQRKTEELTKSSDLQAAVNFELESLANRFLFLDLMIGGAPVAGLFGTVLGLVQVFSEQTLVEHVTMQTIAGGMYVAMVTTVCGLLVALVGIIGRHLLNTRLAEIRDTLTGAR